MEITLHTYANLLWSGQITFSRSLWITVHMSQDECLYIQVCTTAAFLLVLVDTWGDTGHVALMTTKFLAWRSSFFNRDHKWHYVVLRCLP
ncbi:hypothetical protein NP493_373g01012 [Ridgeia piscesae]|uniref:Uncharacterized protein n=1 Tax=Ridgeia piscesae TaxID=27915 RepID=A0AAD9L2Q2_RIDPI|nr:hypothetical protein NP493_373g01012 [Ridgeia piscesae]